MYNNKEKNTIKIWINSGYIKGVGKIRKKMKILCNKRNNKSNEKKSRQKNIVL